ncbi:heterokaryon incompatibility protein-domain-containing protein [Phaeosphaeria sp. MPI-PUGE-AT-0046c]|nr:heterokaryon incompatibility protein-domain-containing protein [Phaeosphaeria sp. MPI-PUGE-AT-0046c]
MKSFHYKSLNLRARSFRLLRLFGGNDLQLECEILEARLGGEDTIPFEALSYAWGNPATPYEIKLNGKYLAITDNLNVALRSLRLEDEDRILWVDAICIDQTNERERGHQVGQMGDIYSQAEQVIFWLGHTTSNVDLVMTALKQLERLSQKEAGCNWSLSDKRWERLWFETRPDWNEQLCDRLKAGLRELMQRPWFERVWILQEVARARRAIISTGNWAISSPIFVVAPILINVIPDPHCQAVLEIMPGTSRNCSWWSQKRDLYTILRKFRRSKASDPRDMIYALLGIMSCDDTDSSSLQPDYSKTTKQVIEHVTFVLFRHRHCYYSDMDNFLKHLPKIIPKAFTYLVGSGRLQDVLEFLQDRGDGINIRTTTLVAAASNMLFGYEIMTILCTRFNISITEQVVTAALHNTSCGDRILHHFIWPPNQRHTQLVLNLVISAAALNIGCARQIFQYLQRQHNKELSDMIDAAISSLHARCVAVGDTDTSISEAKSMQLQLMWTMEQQLMRFFEMNNGENDLEGLKTWLHQRSIV